MSVLSVEQQFSYCCDIITLKNLIYDKATYDEYECSYYTKQSFTGYPSRDSFSNPPAYNTSGCTANCCLSACCFLENALKDSNDITIGYDLKVVDNCTNWYVVEDGVLKRDSTHQNQDKMDKTCSLMQFDNSSITSVDSDIFFGFKAVTKINLNTNSLKTVPVLFENALNVTTANATPENPNVANIDLNNNLISSLNTSFVDKILEPNGNNIEMYNSSIPCCSTAVRRIIDYDIANTSSQFDFTFLGSCIAPTTTSSKTSFEFTTADGEAKTQKSCNTCWNGCSSSVYDFCNTTEGSCNNNQTECIEKGSDFAFNTKNGLCVNVTQAALECNSTTTYNVGSFTCDTIHTNTKGNDNTAIIIGCSVAGGVLLLSIALIAYCVWRKKHKKHLIFGMSPKQFVQEGQADTELVSDEEYFNNQQHLRQQQILNANANDSNSFDGPAYENEGNIIANAAAIKKTGEQRTPVQNYYDVKNDEHEINSNAGAYYLPGEEFNKLSKQSYANNDGQYFQPKVLEEDNGEYFVPEEQ